MAKKTTNKLTPVSKMAGKRRIKACPCVKNKDGNPVTRAFKAEPDFQGICCDECFEIISFEPLEKTQKDDSNKSIKAGSGEDTFTASDSKEAGRDGVVYF